MMCAQLRALEQAAATAEHCEAICKDMVATAYCRAGMLCDLVASVHRAQEHAESVNAAFLSIMQTVEFATDELYRYVQAALVAHSLSACCCCQKAISHCIHNTWLCERLSSVVNLCQYTACCSYNYTDTVHYTICE
jgi:hypothetical protein